MSVDCQGKSIFGTNTSSTYGIYSNQFNTTIKNCNVSNFANGIYFVTGANNGTISNTNASTSQSFSYPNGAAISINGANYVIVSNSNGNALSGGEGIIFNVDTGSTIINSTGTSTSAVGIYFANSKNDAMTGSTGNSTSNIGIFLVTNATGNVIANSTAFSNSYHPIDVSTNSSNNKFINNTIISGNGAGNLLSVASTASSNLFYWNNFTSTSGLYVNDTNGSNYYNTSIAGTPAGNIWYNVINGSVDIGGTVLSPFPGLFYGSTGFGYPYSNTTAQGKLLGRITDYAPLTNETIPPNSTQFNISFQIPRNGTLIYSLNFERYPNSTKNNTYLTTSGTINASLVGRVAPNALTYTDIGTYDFQEETVKNFFGVSALPDIFNRTYGVDFMINGTNCSGQWVSVSVNSTLKMLAYSGSWNNTVAANTVYLTFSSTYGGKIAYNATRTDIPLYIASAS